MHFFYTYIHANLIFLVLVAIALAIGGYAAVRHRKFRLGRRLMIAGIIADVALVGINLTAFVFSLRFDDMIMAAVWAEIAHWSFRKLKGR